MAAAQSFLRMKRGGLAGNTPTENNETCHKFLYWVCFAGAADLVQYAFRAAIAAEIEGVRVTHSFQFAFAMPLRIPLAQCSSST